MAARLLAVALAALAAVAAWLTLGTLAVVEPATRERVGVLPPVWLLGALAMGFVIPVLVRRTPPARLWPLALAGLVCLPWLPGTIPAAFLIWYGPLAALVWLCVGIGLAEPWMRRVAQVRSLAAPAVAPWIAAGIVAATSAMGAWALTSRLPDGDEPHYLVITQSLLADGDLRIENNHARGDYLAYRDGEMRPDYLQRGTNGQIYSIHAPGVSVLVAPAFAVAGWPGAAATMIALAALTTALIWSLSWRLTTDAGAAWVAGALFAGTAPGYFHAFTIFPDGAGALPVALALWVLVRLDRGDQAPPGTLAGVGAALAALPWLHTRFAVLAGGMGLILVLRLWPRDDRWRAVTALLAVPLLSALAWFGFFWLIWGTPNPAAPYGQATQSAWAHLQPGIPGLLFDQQFGLVANAPAYAMALIGLITLMRGRRRLALELTTLLAVYVVAVASYRMWWGGHSAPARFLVAALPLLTVPMASAWARGGAARRAFTLVLLLVSGAIVVTRAAVDHGSLLYNERDGADLLLAWLNQSVSLPMAWPSFHRDPVPAALGDVAMWCAAGAVIGGAGALLVRRVGHAWTCASAAVAVVVMAASTLVWAGPRDSVTPSLSALDLVRQWPLRPRGAGWQSSPARLVTPADAIAARLAISGAALRGRSAGPPPLFAAPVVPAGRYRVVSEGQRASGTLVIAAGGQSQGFESVDLAGRGLGGADFELALPVGVRDLTVQGDEQARATVEHLRLQLVTLPAAAPPYAEFEARRAVRYDRLRVFFLDDEAFAEPTGFWTRGASTTTFVIDRAQPDGRSGIPTHLRLRAGPEATDVDVTSGGVRSTRHLTPGMEEDLALPEGDGPWLVTVSTSGGFRPALQTPGNGDWRHLGVWVEVR